MTRRPAAAGARRERLTPGAPGRAPNVEPETGPHGWLGEQEERPLEPGPAGRREEPRPGRRLGSPDAAAPVESGEPKRACHGLNSEHAIRSGCVINRDAQG